MVPIASCRRLALCLLKGLAGVEEGHHALARREPPLGDIPVKEALVVEHERLLVVVHPTMPFELGLFKLLDESGVIGCDRAEINHFMLFDDLVDRANQFRRAIR